METRMTGNGQIVIPSKIRRRFGMKEGTRVLVDVDESTQRIILTPIGREYIDTLRDRFNGKGLLKALAAEKKRERK